MLTYAQRWTAEIDWSTFDRADRQVAATNGYVGPDVANPSGQRLVFVSSLPPGLLADEWPSPGGAARAGEDDKRACQGPGCGVAENRRASGTPSRTGRGT